MRMKRVAWVICWLVIFAAGMGLASVGATSGGPPPPEWFSFQGHLGWASGPYTPTLVAGRFVAGDFDGDGDGDVAALHDDGTAARWDVWRIQNYGVTAPAPAAWWSGTQVIASEVANRVIAGDLNDDGMDDVAALAGSGSDATWHVWLSTGSGFTYQSGGWWSSTGYVVDRVDNRLVAGDFDGDGDTDAAALYDYSPATTARWHVWLSNGSGFEYQGSNPGWWESTSYLTSRVDDRVVAGDFDGDGADDVGAMYDYGTSTSTWHVWLSDRSGFDYQGSRPGWWESTSFASSDVGDRLVAADFNGDGNDDAAALSSRSWSAWLSTGSSFNFQQPRAPTEGWWRSWNYDTALTEGRVVALAADRNGTADLAALYATGTNSEYRLHTWLTFPGTSPTMVARAGDDKNYLSLALASSGFPIVGFYDDSGPNLKLALCRDISCGAVSIVPIEPRESDTGEYVSLALDNQGLASLSYWDGANRNLKLARCGDPGCSLKTISVVDSTGITGLHTSLALDGAELPVISYFNETSDDLMLARCHDRSCSVRTITTVDSMGSVGIQSSLALDQHGNPVISYTSRDRSKLYLIRCHNATCTSATRREINGDPHAKRFISLALDPSGVPIILYDVATQGLMLSRCQTLACNNPTHNLITDGGSGGAATMVLDGAGNPLIAFHEGAEDTLKLARCVNDRCTRLAIYTLGYANCWSGECTSVAVGSGGGVGVAHIRGSSSVYYVRAPFAVQPPTSPTPTATPSPTAAGSMTATPSPSPTAASSTPTATGVPTTATPTRSPGGEDHFLPMLVR